MKVSFKIAYLVSSMSIGLMNASNDGIQILSTSRSNSPTHSIKSFEFDNDDFNKFQNNIGTVPTTQSEINTKVGGWKFWWWGKKNQQEQKSPISSQQENQSSPVTESTASIILSTQSSCSNLNNENTVVSGEILVTSDISIQRTNEVLQQTAILTLLQQQQQEQELYHSILVDQKNLQEVDNNSSNEDNENENNRSFQQYQNLDPVISNENIVLSSNDTRSTAWQAVITGVTQDVQTIYILGKMTFNVLKQHLGKLSNEFSAPATPHSSNTYYPFGDYYGSNPWD